MLRIAEVWRYGSMYVHYYGNNASEFEQREYVEWYEEETRRRQAKPPL